MQDVFRTRCGPQGEQLMVGVCERPPAANGDEARVAVFREDHGCTPFILSKNMHASPIPGFPGFFWITSLLYNTDARREGRKRERRVRMDRDGSESAQYTWSSVRE